MNERRRSTDQIEDKIEELRKDIERIKGIGIGVAFCIGVIVGVASVLFKG